jgi:hypothetical protein
MQPCPEDFWKFSSTRKLFQGFNSSNLPYKPGTVVTDILIRGGGGTITFSDGVTVEFVFGFIPDDSIPGGGRFGITLQGDRAQLLYQNILTQPLCDTIDWLLQCSDLSRRVSILELQAGLAKEFLFTTSDWDSITPHRIEIPNEGPIIEPGQIGPHELGTDRSYHVTVWRSDGSPVLIGVETELAINLSTGLVTLIKAPLAPSFDGRVVIG